MSRTTETKKKVEEIFLKTKTPLSLKDLYTKVVKGRPHVAYSTVFRIVEKMEQARLLNKVTWKDRGALYEWSQRPHHHHVVCEKCENVEDIYDDVMCLDEKKIEGDTGFTITHHSIELVGVCAPCQKNNHKK